MNASLILSCCNSWLETSPSPYLPTLMHSFRYSGAARLGIFLVNEKEFYLTYRSGRIYLESSNGLRSYIEDNVPYLSADLDTDPCYQAMGLEDIEVFPFEFFGKLLSMI